MKANIKNINLTAYDYILPEENIALHPAGKRNDSKLIISNNNSILHKNFSDISEYLPKNSLLVVNSTKVIAARIKMTKPSGGKAEILCVDPIAPSHDPQICMQARNSCTWRCIVGGKRINESIILDAIASDSEINFKATILKRESNEADVEFTWDTDESFASVLEKIGKMPLPPYIKRETEKEDLDRYQTVYADTEGSVAAPTAGLHFTPEILDKLKTENTIDKCNLILHVGPGTFKPVDTDQIIDHEMHSEQIFVTKEAILEIISALKDKRKIIATGTTSVRTLESLYWWGLKLENNYQDASSTDFVTILQWDPYELAEQYELISAEKSFSNILEWMNNRSIEILNGHTSLFIVPGYEYQLVDILITNFHLPKSTLILLVAAFIGKERWKKLYDSALENDYRFLSYGDSSLLFKE